MSRGHELPIIKNSKSGVIIRHKEYLGDINPSKEFSNETFPLNPGVEKTFPWLHTVAQQFEQYELRGCVFQFRSLSSDTFTTSAGGNTALGSVIMATEYNVYDADYQDKQEMENAEFSNSCKPSCSMLHPIECARGLSTVTRLYVRTPENSTSVGDQRLYDLGKFQIATVGMQGDATELPSFTIGELWVSYEVEFFKPQLNAQGPLEIALWHAGPGSILFTKTAPFGSLEEATVPGSSDIGIFSNGNKFTFRPYKHGEYVFNCGWFGEIGVNTSFVYPAITQTSGQVKIISTKLFCNGNHAQVPTFTSVVGVQSFCSQFCVEVTSSTPDNPASFTISYSGGGNFPTGSSKEMHIHIYKVPKVLGRQLEKTEDLDDFDDIPADPS